MNDNDRNRRKCVNNLGAALRGAGVKQPKRQTKQFDSLGELREYQEQQKITEALALEFKL